MPQQDVLTRATECAEDLRVDEDPLRASGEGRAVGRRRDRGEAARAGGPQPGRCSEHRRGSRRLDDEGAPPARQPTPHRGDGVGGLAGQHVGGSDVGRGDEHAGGAPDLQGLEEPRWGLLSGDGPGITEHGAVGRRHQDERSAGGQRPAVHPGVAPGQLDLAHPGAEAVALLDAGQCRDLRERREVEVDDTQPPDVAREAGCQPVAGPRAGEVAGRGHVMLPQRLLELLDEPCGRRRPGVVRGHDGGRRLADVTGRRVSTGDGSWAVRPPCGGGRRDEESEAGPERCHHGGSPDGGPVGAGARSSVAPRRATRRAGVHASVRAVSHDGRPSRSASSRRGRG